MEWRLGVRLARCLVVVGTLLVIWAGPSVTSARSAPSGAAGNGLLAIQPVDGPGLLLVNPQTGATESICTDSSLCGQPVAPSWSPDGREIVFEDASSERIAIVADDQTCLWCLVGRPLTGVRGGPPTFNSDGKAVILPGIRGSKQGVWKVPLGATASRVFTRTATAVAFSSKGEVAIVRAGAVWVGHGLKRLRYLAAGRAPTWSPDGKRIALVRSGWVAIVSVAKRRLRRLVRGSSPTWSPDGRRLAFVASNHFVYTIAVGGGPWQRVGAASARSVAWQPTPHSRVRACTIPAGATVVASSTQAVVWSKATQSSAPGFATVSYYGCLRTLGKGFRLASGVVGEGSYYYVFGAAVAGRYATLGLSSGDRYGIGATTISAYDLSNGQTRFSEQPTCPPHAQNTGCMFDSVSVNTSGFLAWRSVETAIPTDRTLGGLSCPSVSLCVATDQDGNVLTSSQPTGGRDAWQVANVSSGLGPVSCPSVGLCIAVAGNQVFTSTAPTGGAGAWQATPLSLAHEITHIVCPSSSLCMGTDDFGDVLSSTNPMGDPAAWKSVNIDGGTPLNGLSCPSVLLCVAVDIDANVLTSTNPTGDATAWSSADVDPEPNFPSLTDISCPSTSLCVASASDRTGGNLAISTNPTGGASAWTLTNVDPQREPTGVTCASTSLCVAFDSVGNVMTSTNPTGGPAAWTISSAGLYQTNATCPSTSLCVAVDGSHILSSTTPADGTSWTTNRVDIPDCAVTTPCQSEHVYAHDDRGTQDLDSSTPGSANAITNLQLSGNALTLTWTHDGTPHQFGLN